MVQIECPKCKVVQDGDHRICHWCGAAFYRQKVAAMAQPTAACPTCAADPAIYPCRGADPSACKYHPRWQAVASKAQVAPSVQLNTSKQPDTDRCRTCLVHMEFASLGYQTCTVQGCPDYARLVQWPLKATTRNLPVVNVPAGAAVLVIWSESPAMRTVRERVRVGYSDYSGIGIINQELDGAPLSDVLEALAIEFRRRGQ